MKVYSQIVCLKHFFQLQNLLVQDLFCWDYEYGSFVDSPPWDDQQREVAPVYFPKKQGPLDCCVIMGAWN